MGGSTNSEFLTGCTLILGGARSGKSAFGEQQVIQTGLKPIYIATSQIWDEEMRARVDAHIARRTDVWTTIEAPNKLEEAIRDASNEDRVILVDCLTLWVTNLMLADEDVHKRSALLCQTLREINSPVVLVSNEVGFGIVPENKMAREFRDYAGALHQQIASISNNVYLIAAGLPLKMKG